MLDLDAIEARAAAATPGPWWVERPEGHDAYIAYGTRGDGADTFDLYDLYNVDTDYAFMAHARTDVPALIAEVRALRKERPNAE